MHRSLLLLLGIAAASAFAQNPGSRIGTTPEVPLAPQPEASQLTRRCDGLRGKERDRCLKEARSAAPSTSKPSGPEATGMAPGSAGGTAASPGAGAPGGGTVGAGRR
jgi:hypothetical protein